MKPTRPPRRPTTLPAPIGPDDTVHRRIQALTRLSTQLASVRSERELATRLAESLRGLFQARQVGLYVRSPSTRQLVPTPGTPGDGLLRLVCAVAPGLPEPLRISPSGPDLLDLLARPLRAGEDGVRGPLLAAPLADANGSHGILAIEGEPRQGSYSLLELDTFVGIAAQACMALGRLRVERTAAEQAATPHDFAQASAVQRALLPSLPATLAGFHIAVEYSPAYHVGGDFYDVVEVGPGAIMALVGDVAGKGVSAALMMSRIGAEFRRLCDRGAMPHHLLAALNRSMCDLLPSDTFATAACVRLDAQARTMLVANAGHVHPVVRRRGGGVVSVGRAAGAALGMLPDESYGEQHVPLAPGDIVLLMTDGVVEAVERDPRNMWKLIDLIAQAPPDVHAISARILAAVEQALGSRRADDVTLLALSPVDAA